MTKRWRLALALVSLFWVGSANAQTSVSEDTSKQSGSEQPELLIIGAMHTVPNIVKGSYAPMLKYALKYSPEAILTEDIQPEDTASLRIFTPRFLKKAQDAEQASALDHSRMSATLQKPLEKMSHEDFEFLAHAFLVQRDRANYAYYTYLAQYGLEGMKKAQGNETDDLIHKLAIAIRSTQLLPIDDHHTDPDYHKYTLEALRAGVDNGDYALYLKLNKRDYRSKIFPALMGRLGKATNRLKALERIYSINSFRFAKHPNELTEKTTRAWDERNETMARNIRKQILETGKRRYVLVVGAGHVISLRNALQVCFPELKVRLME